MLPAILVTLATFLLELYTASPVYNMQPAFITANIGTTGRNIRNLPCISRKNNQSGVCMFAIDCLKANGTHLGTCIDRFYFGSCCHIEPIHDIIENTIDTDIIPAREPPQRLSSTIKPMFGITKTTTKTTTLRVTERPKIPISILTTRQPPVTTTKTTVTTPRVTTTTQTTTTPRTTTTARITTTSRPTTTRRISTSNKPEAVEEETTIGYKLTTFQSVDGAVETTTITKVVPTTTKPTTKPTKTKPKPSLKPITTAKPKPTRGSTLKPATKPVPIITKPTKTTTRKPISTSKKPTTTTKPTKRFTTATIRTTTSTTKPTTRSPSTTKTRRPTTTSTTTRTTTTTTTTTIRKPTTTTTTTTTKLPIQTTTNGSLLEKIPLSSTEPQIVTWTLIDTDRNATTPPIIATTINSTTTEDWLPITTPDGWVLLPSVPPSTTTGRPLDTVITTMTPPPTTSLPPAVTATPTPTVILTSTPTPIGTTTRTTATTLGIESTSKPSITFIPIESSTTMTLNLSTVEGTSTASTPQSTPVTSAPPLTTSLPEELRPVNMSDFTDVCGRRMYPEARIVGGEKSSFGKWPWQISLRQWRTSTYLHKCGAALLNENWAITAAHCVDNVPPSDLLLRLGEHDLSTESEPYLHQERRVQIVASHPQFDPRTFEYDLALLRFYEPVTFQPNILPVCVPQTDENFVGRTAYVTGWGRLYEDGPLPSILQEVSVPVINNTVCESMYRAAGYIEHIPHIFICAGWRRGGFDSCEGDSGGPMVIQREDKRFLLAGVISWGIGCAEPNQPGVYTRISEFRDWINQILQF